MGPFFYLSIFECLGNLVQVCPFSSLVVHVGSSEGPRTYSGISDIFAKKRNTYLYLTIYRLWEIRVSKVLVITIFDKTFSFIKKNYIDPIIEMRLGTKNEMCTILISFKVC